MKVMSFWWSEPWLLEEVEVDGIIRTARMFAQGRSMVFFEPLLEKKVGASFSEILRKPLLPHKAARDLAVWCT
jgi:hypothetical protein